VDALITIPWGVGQPKYAQIMDSNVYFSSPIEVLSDVRDIRWINGSLEV
jgi:hypothetical protein